MATSTKDALNARWHLFGDDGVVGLYVEENAIPAYFREHPEIGSPVDREDDWEDTPGGKIQTFSNGIVVWDQDNGARVVTT